jgi:capsular exopolysaccharide synthesis family protein
MSRIDDALRQVEGGAEPEPPEARTRTPDPLVLERYRSELQTPKEPRPGLPLSPPSPPIVHAVPRRRAQAQSYLLENLTEPKLVVNGSATPLVREQYRRLAASLHSLQVERGLKTLVITSALPHDGKSLTLANLALTLSESYARRVLLIDADLRQSSLHRLFGVANGAGLSEAIQFPSRTPATLEISANLTLLPGGQAIANPLAALSSERMRSLLEELAAKFDWVLLDAPPVGLLPDGLILTRMTGACVLVIRAGATPFAAVERAISELGRECIIGTVLNGVDDGSFPSSQYGEYLSQA